MSGKLKNEDFEEFQRRIRRGGSEVDESKNLFFKAMESKIKWTICSVSYEYLGDYLGLGFEVTLNALLDNWDSQKGKTFYSYFDNYVSRRIKAKIYKDIYKKTEISLDGLTTPSGEDESHTDNEFVKDFRELTPKEAYEASLLAEELEETFYALNSKIQTILIDHYSYDKKTRQIGDELGISHSQVVRKKNQQGSDALQRLKNVIENFFEAQHLEYDEKIARKALESFLIKWSNANECST